MLRSPHGSRLPGRALALVLGCLASAPAAGAGAQPLAWTGDGASAVPALRRVGVPSSAPEGGGVAGEAGYALTEPVFDGDGDHHRVLGSIAGSLRPLPWLAFWLRADGRYDRHPPDDAGRDDGLQGVPRLGARLGATIDPMLALGLDLELLVPGGDAPSFEAAAFSFEARALAALRPSETVTIALLAGLRLDNSGATVPRPTPYRRGDQIALGASDYSAVLAGVGAAFLLVPVELFVEATFDAFVGDGAPDAGVFPLRGSAGARLYVMRGLSIEVGAEVLASVARPAVSSWDPLVPVEPRFSAHAALRFAMPFSEPSAAEGAAVPEPAEPEAPPAPERGVVVGRVVDDRGAPLSGARVTLTPAEGEPIEVVAGEDGAYRLEAVPLGAATLRVVADEHHEHEQPIEVRAGENALEPAALEPSVPRGQLRGMIRSYDGRALVARVVVEDLGVEAQSDEEGFFEIDVAPGEHVVIIEAPGHRGQRRTVDVPENGVTVLNVDLRRGRSR